MVSKVCSRSQGQPPGARNRAMMETAISNFSPVDTDLMYHLGLLWRIKDLTRSQQTHDYSSSGFTTEARRWRFSEISKRSERSLSPQEMSGLAPAASMAIGVPHFVSGSRRKPSPCLR